MRCNRITVVAILAVGCFVMAGSAGAQGRTMTPRSIQQRYGVQGAYNGTSLHPDGRQSTAVPITLDDGRTGELVIPSGTTDADKDRGAICRD